MTVICFANKATIFQAEVRLFGSLQTSAVTFIII